MTYKEQGRCRRCNEPKAAHGTEWKMCPDGSGRRYQGHIKHGVSNSFTEREVLVLAALLNGTLRNADLKRIREQPEFPNLVRKINAMKAKVDETSTRRKP